MSPFCACRSLHGVNQINGVQWNETVNFCGDFNWFINFVQTIFFVFNDITESIMISWSQNYIKMRSSYLLIYLHSGIPTSEFLPGSVLHRVGTRVFFPGLIYIYLSNESIFTNFVNFIYKLSQLSWSNILKNLLDYSELKKM